MKRSRSRSASSHCSSHSSSADTSLCVALSESGSPVQLPMSQPQASQQNNMHHGLPVTTLQPGPIWVVSDSDDEDDDWHGLDDSSRVTLSQALGVEYRVVPVETLAYTLLCKRQRGAQISKADMLEVWDACPKKFLLRDKENPQARMLVLGINPRNTKLFTLASTSMPHVHDLDKQYMLQIAPTFKWSCLCFRMNGGKEPHRDARNVGDNLVIALTQHTDGGGLWLHELGGSVFRDFQGRSLPGKIVPLDAPCIFPARSQLHATQDWQEERRVVMVAFTPIGTLSFQEPQLGRPAHAARQTSIHDYFWLSTPSD